MKRIVTATLTLGFVAALSSTAFAGCKGHGYVEAEPTIQTAKDTTKPVEAMSTHDPEATKLETPERKSE